MTKEETLLINQIDDKRMQCEDQYCLTHTAFLDVHQCAIAENEFKYSKHILYGGYDDAERRVMVFLPDYLDDIDDSPLEILRVSVPKGSKALTHRDYLGSILSLGIDRNVTGDIIVRSNGADIIILKTMEEFLLSHYDQAGHVHLKTEIKPIEELDLGEIHTSIKHDTIASARLDNIVGSAFNLSRTKAQDAITAGLVFVDNIQCTKPDKEIEENTKVVLRGKGKIILKNIGQKTKKDRLPVELEIYK
ncbi:MAG: YlmH/Sll1252 family protein [Bacillota bacterium]|nr:YlmH/Sll1252 family protein [Bacillota bacterium]